MTNTPKPLRSTRRTAKPGRRIVAAFTVPVVTGASVAYAPPATGGMTDRLDDYRSLDGSGNNPNDDDVGRAGTVYPRIADANYADGIGDPVDGPSERYLSNRIFNDVNQNIFSENGVSHWTFVWGQLLDHTFGLRAESDEEVAIAFEADDPLEEFTNDLGSTSSTRSAAAEGTGIDTIRQQTNTVSSFIDAWAVYGGSEERLDWLRSGKLDGDPTNNDATLLDVDGYLPTGDARPAAEAPAVDLMGRLSGDPSAAVIAGDIRANENLGLTAVHTLLLREHNRIVESLPEDMGQQTKFQVARRVVSALQQFITYNEFLPAMGVDLPDYEGYDDTVDPSITNEFATVGYRAHSAIHGEFEAELAPGTFPEGGLGALESQGVEVVRDGEAIEVAIPLNVAFGNPGLLQDVGLGNLLTGLGSESAYANDEQIDNQLRSVLFQVPGPDVTDPSECLDGTEIAGCFSGVSDLGALDVMRGADHGMPAYNDLREALGLPRADSFTALTGEDTDEFPDDPEIDATDPIDDPDILDFTELRDGDGNTLEPGSEAADTTTVTATRRSTTAARLKAIYGDVDSVDAFTGMVSEPHVAGSEFGALQLAMWTNQFQALRDGDRYFYANDPVLDEIQQQYGIDYRRTLTQLIADNTEVEESELQANMFRTPDAQDGDADPEDPTTASDTEQPRQSREPEHRNPRPRKHRHDRAEPRRERQAQRPA